MAYSIEELSVRVEQRPDSAGLQMALEAALLLDSYRSTVSHTESMRFYPVLRNDYLGDKITASDTVLAYGLARGDHAQQWETELALAEHGNAGVPVVSYVRTSMVDGSKDRIRFNPRESGRLAEDVKLFMPKRYYGLRPGLKYEGRLKSITPSEDVAVGENAVARLYGQALGYRKPDWYTRGYDLHEARITNAVVMQRLGMIGMRKTFEREKNVVRNALAANLPWADYKDTGMQRVVREMHRLSVLDPATAEVVLRDVMLDDTSHIHNPSFVETVARIISDEEAIDYDDYTTDKNWGHLHKARLHALALLRLVDYARETT